MSDRHERLEALFHEALQLSVPERETFVRSLAARHPRMAAELSELLAAEPSAPDLMARLSEAVPDFAASADRPGDEPAADGDASAAEEAAGTSGSEGTRVGPYRLGRELGRGGMGVVYEAERVDGAFARRVAVKLVKRGMDSGEVVRRFRAERQILAGLQHPGIARIYDGGVADDGRPYLVMEHVDGRPINEHADGARLSVSQRIGLFRDVCSAVAFAHGRLVVHRDLKPTNILVEADGAVKLLDFGIAKLLDADAEDLTRAEGRVLTPAYAAPEQAAGAPATTSVDVYSLGVVLHELLAGRRPSGEDSRPSRTVGVSYEESVRGGGTRTVTPDELSERRGTTPIGLRTALTGDLDAIVLRALAQDPAERYSSVEALLDDLERHRASLPVSARLPTMGYRVRRFLRRNRVPVAAASAVAASLSVGLGVALVQRDLAREERDGAEAVTAYLEDIFESVSPVGSDPGADTLRVVHLLDRATERALGELEDQPALQARLLRTLGRAHFSLWEYDRAEELWSRGRAVAEGAGLDPDPELQVGLAEVAMERAEWEAADVALSELLEAARADRDDAEVARLLRLRARGFLYRDAFDDARAALVEAVGLLRETGPEGSLADALYMLAGAHLESGDPAGALDPQREGLELYRRLRGDDGQAAAGLANLGVILRITGRLEEADTVLAEALRILRERTPPGAPTYLGAVIEYANLRARTGDVATADSLLRVAADWADGAGDRRRLINVLANHSTVLRSAGNATGALALSRRAADEAREIYGAGSPATAPFLTMLALSLDASGDSTLAEARYAEVLEALGPDVEPTRPEVLIAERAIARGASRAGRHAVAVDALLELLERVPASVPPLSDRYRARQATLRELADAYERWGRPEDAGRYRVLREREAAAATPGQG